MPTVATAAQLAEGEADDSEVMAEARAIQDQTRAFRKHTPAAPECYAPGWFGSFDI